jgi:hypothetical protein
MRHAKIKLSCMQKGQPPPANEHQSRRLAPDGTPLKQPPAASSYEKRLSSVLGYLERKLAGRSRPNPCVSSKTSARVWTGWSKTWALNRWPRPPLKPPSCRRNLFPAPRPVPCWACRWTKQGGWVLSISFHCINSLALIRRWICHSVGRRSNPVCGLMLSTMVDSTSPSASLIIPKKCPPWWKLCLQIMAPARAYLPTA